MRAASRATLRSAFCIALALACTGLRAANCPPPPACQPAEDRTCDPNGDTTTFTFSTTTCFGATPSETVTTDTTDGALTGVDICVGPERSVGFFVCPGTSNVNTNIETVLDVGKVFADGFEQGPP